MLEDAGHLGQAIDLYQRALVCVRGVAEEGGARGPLARCTSAHWCGHVGMRVCVCVCRRAEGAGGVLSHVA